MLNARKGLEDDDETLKFINIDLTLLNINVKIEMLATAAITLFNSLLLLLLLLFISSSFSPNNLPENSQINVKLFV